MTDSMLIGQDVEDYIASDIKDDLYVNNLFTHILRLNGEEQSAGQIGVIIQDLVPTKCVVLRGYLRREVKNDIQDDTAEKR